MCRIRTFANVSVFVVDSIAMHSRLSYKPPCSCSYCLLLLTVCLLTNSQILLVQFKHYLILKCIAVSPIQHYLLVSVQQADFLNQYLALMVAAMHKNVCSISVRGHIVNYVLEQGLTSKQHCFTF